MLIVRFLIVLIVFSIERLALAYATFGMVFIHTVLRLRVRRHSAADLVRQLSA